MLFNKYANDIVKSGFNASDNLIKFINFYEIS